MVDHSSVGISETVAVTALYTVDIQAENRRNIKVDLPGDLLG